MKPITDKSDWLNSHLYLSHKFNRELNDNGILRVSDLESLTILDLVSTKEITIARLKRIIRFMAVNSLRFKDIS